MDVLAEQGQGLRYCLMREASRWVHIGLDAPSWRVCSCTGPRAPSRLHCVWGPESLLGSSGLVVKMGSSGGSKNGVLPALMFNTCQRRSPKRTNDVNQDSRGKKGLRQWARAGHRTWGGGGGTCHSRIKEAHLSPNVSYPIHAGSPCTLRAKVATCSYELKTFWYQTASG